MAERNESQDERESRLLLIKFLTTTDNLLERLLQRLVLDSHDLTNKVGAQLQRIWTSARLTLKKVTESVRIGLSRARREGLNQIGMFGEALAAKYELLTFDIHEGALKRVMKRLNSMLSSLAKVFPALHAVKEFKDHIEATVEGLKQTPEFITLKDILQSE